MPNHDLNDREKSVLNAVIRCYVDTAEPAGSRTIAKRFPLGVSAATIRNVMSDLEDRGYLYHPHTSAGRIPTDLAYRFYVDAVMETPALPEDDRAAVRRELSRHSAIETILEQAADVLGVLSAELGVAAVESFGAAVLERLEMIRVSSERLLIVLVLKGATARTLFIEVVNEIPDEAIERVARVLNERLAGETLDEIRTSISERLSGVDGDSGEEHLVNIFVEEADSVFAGQGGKLLLGSAKMLAEQPEFSSNEKMRELLHITERKEFLRSALRSRDTGGVTVTIGAEHLDPQLNDFTVVTSTYQHSTVSGVIGVMGPTRMPYDKIIALVEYTSRLVSELGGGENRA